jgi:hypothetical protein
MEQHMQKRRGFEHIITPQDVLVREARQLREEAGKLPACPQQAELLRKARQADTASHIEAWLRSAELRPPT